MCRHRPVNADSRLHTHTAPRPKTHSHTYEAPVALDPNQPYPTLLPTVPATVTMSDMFAIATNADLQCFIKTTTIAAFSNPL